MSTRKTGGTSTSVAIDLIVAGGAILAGGGGTLVDVDGAVRVGESKHARASIAIDKVVAGCTVLAQV